MTTRQFGEPVKRNEDARLLAGRAQFIDDVSLPGMLHAAFLRSPYAHARLKSIDVAPALAREGVVAVYTARDLGDYWRPGPIIVPPPPVEGAVFNERTQVPLVKDKVRHVGEPVAMVVATSRYIAEDAAADVAVDWEPLPVAAELAAAAAPGAPRVHDDLPDNVAAHVRQTKGDYAAAAKRAHRVIKRRFAYDHGCAQPMETRGVVAQWDAGSERLTVWDTTQAPIAIRNGLAGMLGLSERQVRVVAPFIGGGFGPKIMMFYPDEVLVPWAAMKLDRPVKWIEDRAEHFVATTHERGQMHDAEIALAADGKHPRHQGRLPARHRRLRPVRPDRADQQPVHAARALRRAELRQHVHRGLHQQADRHAVPRRRPAARRVRDRAAARHRRARARHRPRGDPAAELHPAGRVPVRQRDHLPGLHADSPTTAATTRRSSTKALDLIGYERFVREEQPRLRAEGKHVGIGVVCYVEGTGIGPYEGAKVQVQTNGKASVLTGIGTQGQGHFTSFAQIVADQVGVDVDDVEVITGDTDQFYWGAGTFASRGAVVAGNAVSQAAVAVRQKILRTAAEHFECAEADLVIGSGRVAIAGVPGRSIALGELAVMANPMRGAVTAGTEPGLEATSYFGPESGATSSGVHAMIVAVDPETMIPEILKYVVVHDCGTLINPLIVEGQVHGGVAQGIGNAFYEQLVFDGEGQLLNATLADYLLPTALDVPRMTLAHTVTPSPLNPLGIKGVGEAGAIPVGPLFAQALEDALGLPAKGVELLEIPLSPSRLWELARAGS